MGSEQSSQSSSPVPPEELNNEHFSRCRHYSPPPPGIRNLSEDDILGNPHYRHLQNKGVPRFELRNTTDDEAEGEEESKYKIIPLQIPNQNHTDDEGEGELEVDESVRELFQGNFPPRSDSLEFPQLDSEFIKEDFEFRKRMAEREYSRPYSPVSEKEIGEIIAEMQDMGLDLG